MSEASEQVSAAEGTSEASSPEQANECAMRANGRVSGRVLSSGFSVALAHSAMGVMEMRRIWNNSTTSVPQSVIRKNDDDGFE